MNLNSFWMGCLFPLHLFDLIVFFNLTLSSVTCFFIFYFSNKWDCAPALLVFGLSFPAVEFLGNWLQSGSVEMWTSLWLIFPGNITELFYLFGLSTPALGSQDWSLTHESGSHKLWGMWKTNEAEKKRKQKKKKSRKITKDKK